MATPNEFEHYIQQAIPAYTEKELIEVLKSEIETLKEENRSKLKHYMNETEILIKRQTETLNEEEPKQMYEQKLDKRENIHLNKKKKRETDLLHLKTLKMKSGR